MRPRGVLTPTRLVRGGAAAALLVLSACYYGKVEAGRAYDERRLRVFRSERAGACFCVSGARCDSPESGYPASPDVERARVGERCCTSSNCSYGLACDAQAAPSICAPLDAVAENEAVASCAATAPKVWERASPAECGRGGRDAPGYEPLRWAVGPNIDRVRYVTTADRATLRSIERGVFLVLSGSGSGSRGSGPSTLPPSVEMLRAVLAQVEPSVEVVVAEKRCLARDLITLLKLRCDERGDGEVAWVRHGKLIATTGYGFHPEAILPNTQQLLSLP